MTNKEVEEEKEIAVDEIEEELVLDEEELENDGTVPTGEGDVKLEDLTIPQLAQAFQTALTNVVSSVDMQLRTLKEDLDGVKRYEGKQEGFLNGKLEGFEGRIKNMKTRLLKVETFEKMIKNHTHTTKRKK